MHVKSIEVINETRWMRTLNQIAHTHPSNGHEEFEEYGDHQKLISKNKKFI